MKQRDILLVDDDACSLHFLSSILRHERFDVSVATNGSNALELLEDERAGLLITDFNMPEMNGLELASCAHERYPGMTIFMITANALGDVVEGAVNAGISSVFSKPLEINDFVTAIRSVLYTRPDEL